MLVKGVFWCWLKGRFGGASLLMDGGGVLVEGAFWCRGRFGGGRAGWVGRGFKVQKYTLEKQK